MADGNNSVNSVPTKSYLATDGSGKSKSDTPKRASWGSPLEFILACLGYAVGLGNVWRFPYLCYRNGGGAFLIPFFLMIILIGLPIFYLELYMGQYTALGPIKAFSYISPFFSGVGYCTLVVISLISIYYMIIVAWTLYYTIVSIIGNLDWGSCENEFNSIHCYSTGYDLACRENNTGAFTDLTYYMKNCMTVGDVCKSIGLDPFDGTYCSDGDSEAVLGRGDATWSNWGTIQWHLVGCLFASWFIAFLCVIKGVQSAGKVVYFTALFPYVMLTALLIRGVTLEGAVDGILFYLSPKWETLLEAKVWGDAASQVTAFTCFTCFVLGLPMCFSGGVYLFTVLDWNTASWAVLLIGIAECTAVSWSYGINRAISDLGKMNMKFNRVVRFYWKAAWTVTVPCASLGVLIFVFIEWTSPYYGDYEFPLFADILGWAVGLSTVVLFPVGVCWALYSGNRGRDLFTPSDKWKPAVNLLDSDELGYDNVAAAH
ncbi:unnamed protein product [Leptidea sinapis]|uniref:Transporter n=1 Tax=Leptidea sinapis TaxID=189913 RepID=A0A5E4Q170_9NEOP|nr:unnamed protein product [Leptidea sinapis]